MLICDFASVEVVIKNYLLTYLLTVGTFRTQTNRLDLTVALDLVEINLINYHMCIIVTSFRPCRRQRNTNGDA